MKRPPRPRCAHARLLLCFMIAFSAASVILCSPIPHSSPAPVMVDIPAGDFLMGFSLTPLPPSLGAAATFFPDGDADEQPYAAALRLSRTHFL